MDTHSKKAIFFNLSDLILEACIKESMRLHPATTVLVPHRSLEACQIMNYGIPKNARVLVNIWAIGRDPSFSAGRRICPGFPFAAKIVPLILISFIHFFDLSLPDGLEPSELRMTEKYGVTTQMEHPLLLLLKAR